MSEIGSEKVPPQPAELPPVKWSSTLVIAIDAGYTALIGLNTTYSRAEPEAEVLETAEVPQDADGLFSFLATTMKAEVKKENGAGGVLVALHGDIPRTTYDQPQKVLGSAYTEGEEALVPAVGMSEKDDYVARLIRARFNLCFVNYGNLVAHAGAAQHGQGFEQVSALDIAPPGLSSGTVQYVGSFRAIEPRQPVPDGLPAKRADRYAAICSWVSRESGLVVVSWDQSSPKTTMSEAKLNTALNDLREDPDNPEAQKIPATVLVPRTGPDDPYLVYGGTSALINSLIDGWR